LTFDYDIDSEKPSFRSGS